MSQPRRRFAGAVKVGEKGQIVIPKAVRDMLSIRPGDTLLILADTKQGIAILRDDKLFEKLQNDLGIVLNELGSLLEEEES